MKKNLLYLIACTILVFGMTVGLTAGCKKEKPVEIKYELNRKSSPPAAYPDANFAVISDLHIYDPSLGSSGAAFEKTMNSDRKLLLDGIDLLDYAIETIIAAGVEFVLIPGDLTKDGELINHRLAAGRLRKFSDAGIKVFVVPGNHDINNPGAVRYEGEKTAEVATVSPGDFAEIHGDFGFKSALMRDGDSLSYVAEALEGLWILALDTCRYRENEPGKEEIVSGRISQKTADWIAGVLQTAADRNKSVMVMQHHGVVEHWKGQSKLHPSYLLTGYKAFGEFLASYNVRLAFTGHYHAQDITRGQFGDKFIYDIETGSLVTAPCPIRFLKIKNNTVQIESVAIVDKLHPGTDFAAKGLAFVKKTVMLEALGVLKKYKVSDKDANFIADAVGDAFTAHYSGDEDPALRPILDKKNLGLWGRFILAQQQYVLDGLWADLPPADIAVRLEL